MITEIRLKNFKRFKDINILFKPLTLLAGINGMGKSTIIQSLLVLKQSEISGSLKDGLLDLSGDYAQLGRGKDVLFEAAETDVIEIGLTLAENKSTTDKDFKFWYSETLDQLKSLSSEIDAKNVPLSNGGFQYLCAERLGPRKFLPLSESKVRNRNVGIKGEYVFHALLSFGNDLLEKSDLRLLLEDVPSIRAQTQAWLNEISPGIQLEIQPNSALDAAIGSYAYQQPGDVTTVGYRPTNVGFGISYVLPIIVACLLSKRGDTIIIENPEAHIHPHGQTRIGQLLALTTQMGVQVIVETHSDHIMNGIRVSVKSNKVAAESVAFHYVESSGNTAKVTSPKIDKNGRLESWPTGFFDEHEDNLARLIS